MLYFLYRHFEVGDKDNEKEASKIFSVPDFVGDACKAIASHVRGAVAGVQFDDFHKVNDNSKWILGDKFDYGVAGFTLEQSCTLCDLNINRDWCVACKCSVLQRM